MSTDWLNVCSHYAPVICFRHPPPPLDILGILRRNTAENMANLHIDDTLGILHHIYIHISALQRIRFCIPNLTLRMLYNTLFLPLFDYGNIIYRTTDQTYLK